MIMGLEDRACILRRSRDDTWQLVNDRLTNEVDRASASLSDRVEEIERQMVEIGIYRNLAQQHSKCYSL